MARELTERRAQFVYDAARLAAMAANAPVIPEGEYPLMASITVFKAFLSPGMILAWIGSFGFSLRWSCS